MKKVLMFYLKRCPHCRGAMGYEEELKEEYPEFSSIEIERVEESENPETAESYDYYYVPTYYVDGVKLHEGVNSKEDIKRVFNAALE